MLADLLLKNCQVINVINGEITPTSIAIHRDRIVGFGECEAKEAIDLNGQYVCPSFIDSHVHIESSMLNPAEFSNTAVSHGTGTIICDPSKIATLLGVSGVKYLLSVTENLPLEVYFDLALCHSLPVPKNKRVVSFMGEENTSECATIEEARIKLKLGKFIKISSKNLNILFPLITPQNAHAFSFCTDKIGAEDLKDGHINLLVKKAVEMGMDPVMATRLASYNPAIHYGVKNVGAVAPGYYADFVMMNDLHEFKIKMVYKRGKLIFQRNKLRPQSNLKKKRAIKETVNIKSFKTDDLKVNDKEKMLKFALFDRCKASPKIHLGLVPNFGLEKGALAQSIERGVIVVGMDEEDMAGAVRQVVKMKGGIAVVAGGLVLSQMALPIAGLMSEESVDVVIGKIEKLEETVRKLGCLIDNPFVTLANLNLQTNSK